jgi:hypothetical protein
VTKVCKGCDKNKARGAADSRRATQGGKKSTTINCRLLAESGGKSAAEIVLLRAHIGRHLFFQRAKSLSGKKSARRFITIESSSLGKRYTIMTFAKRLQL